MFGEPLKVIFQMGHIFNFFIFFCEVNSAVQLLWRGCVFKDTAMLTVGQAMALPSYWDWRGEHKGGVLLKDWGEGVKKKLAFSSLTVFPPLCKYIWEWREVLPWFLLLSGVLWEAGIERRSPAGDQLLTFSSGAFIWIPPLLFHETLAFWGHVGIQKLRSGTCLQFK